LRSSATASSPKTGTRYAKAWVDFGGTRLTLTGNKVKAHWDYQSGLVGQITPAMRMDLEQAKAFITLYGQCARCSRKLKAAESVAEGVGPVCKKWFSF
jgi:lactam utilization protein B